MENFVIEKIDNQGRGITFINGKIAFIKGALPKDEVSVKIKKEKSKYIIGEVDDVIKPSPLRVESPCVYSKKCGGCKFMDVSYEDSFNLKVESFKNYLKKNSIITEPVLIKNPSPYNYRNKISLKIAGGKIGFYEESSNKIVEIKKCMIASESINNFLQELKSFGIQNGFVNVRSNYKDELLVSINTKDKMNFSDLNVANLMVNNELIKGEKFFVDRINDFDFEISYDAFFQVNPYITSGLFNLINENIKEEDIVLDLYCGVGTLGINVSNKAKYVYGIESVKSAVINANNNALINKIDNATFKVGDLSKKINVKKEFNTLIIDPPRSGIDNVVMNFIKEKKPNKLIYVSCDYQTLVRDLKILDEDYEIKNLYTLDMFSFSHHLENLCVLEKKLVNV